MSLAAFGVRKPLVVNLLMYGVIAAGLIFGLGLKREFFPEIQPDRIIVTAPYPGASPAEVEKSLTKKIEDRLEDIDGIKETTSVSTEGLCSITLEFTDGTDIDEAMFEVKREVDALQDLPAESDRIVVTKLEPNMPVIVVSLAGDGDERDMKAAIREVRDDLRRLPGMGDLLEGGVRADELLVEVDPAAMLRYGLPITDVSDRVTGAMLELPGGSVRTPRQNVAVRTMGADERAAAVREIVVRTTPGGEVVRLGDVAAVTPGFADVELFSRLGGKPAVSLTVFKVGDQDAVEIAEMVKAYVAGRNGVAVEPTWRERVAMNLRPPGDAIPVSARLRANEIGLASTSPLPGELTTTTDLARFIVGRMNLLTTDAVTGGILVLVTLIALLNLRVALWTASGMVVSIMGTLAVMYFVGQSLNLLTMFGLIVVLGLLVDDAIVVAENITARYEAGEPPLSAAVTGTRQVYWPVVATMMTAIAAFLPLGLIGGQIGDMLMALPIIVVCALGSSLVEALLILPSHMGHSLLGYDRRNRLARPGLLTRAERRMDAWRQAGFMRVVLPAYAGFMQRALRYRYLSFSIAVGLVIISLGMVAGGRVGFTFFAEEDAETVSVELRMPVGTPSEETNAAITQIEAAATAQPDVVSAYVQVGALASLDGEGSIAQGQVGQLILELAPVEHRDRSSAEIIESIKAAHGPIAGVKSLRYEAMSGGPSGPSISLAVVGESMPSILEASNRLRDALTRFEGVSEISDDHELGRRELRFRLRDDARTLGLTDASVARQARGMVFGLEAHTFAGDREDVDVRVTLPGEYRRSLANLENIKIFTPDGTAVPLREVVEIEAALGYSAIRRLDGERVVTVTAKVDGAVQSSEKVMASLRPEMAAIEAGTHGVRILERGRQKEMQESMSSLPLGMLAAAGMIYVILAWLFESYTQPLIVMMAIPFATIGTVWGHWIMGFDITFLSLIGFIALSGVVVNDSLIFMEFFNQKREEGMPVHEAAKAAGCARIRAIVLTTLGTVLGLLPLVLERSFQARFLIPMAITIAFGLMSATVIVLVVLPSMLVVFDDTKRVARWLWTGRWTAESAAPSHGGAA